MTEDNTEKSPPDENLLTIELKDGMVGIELFPEDAPNHVERIKELAEAGLYDGVAFHRVMEGFMAQTGDVKYGNSKEYNQDKVGTGGSEKPDLKAEFNEKKHVRGTCSMARSNLPDSANSQFFICFDPSGFLDGEYTVWGQVIEGMEHVDKIKRGSSGSGSVTEPDIMVKVFPGKGNLSPSQASSGDAAPSGQDTSGVEAAEHLKNLTEEEEEDDDEEDSDDSSFDSDF